MKERNLRMKLALKNARKTGKIETTRDEMTPNAFMGIYANDFFLLSN